ncbi:MAG: hypothetical protein Q7T79_01345 [bacterium]|nr:hypothetical protein [bacterium]
MFSINIYASIENLVLTDVQKNHFNNLIEKNVDPNFQEIAKSLITRSKVIDVKIVQNRVVIEIDTSGMTFKVEVNNGNDSYKKTKAFQKISKIPFPRTEDIVFSESKNYAYPTGDYRAFMRNYGLSTTAGDALHINQISLYFMKIEHKPLFGPKQRVLIKIFLNESGNSFDGEERFGWNACDESACWGSYNTIVELVHSK